MTAFRLTRSIVADAVRDAIPRIACEQRPDILRALRHAREVETSERAMQVLDQLLENATIAAEDRVPLCQDTGSVWVLLEVGYEETVPGDIFLDVDAAVAEAYESARLRKSLLRDAFCDRVNTGDNTPAFCDLVFRPGTGATLHVMLKGGGSDNASRTVMLPPGAGQEGIEEVVLAAVREKASNACPPLIIGVGIGTTFDHVGMLAKKALLRPIGERSDVPEVAVLEEGILGKVNATGIGPGALGGLVTAFDVHVETAPCHIAALPVAVNMGCIATRSASIELLGAD
ncbi:MAG: fumarate hydratase [Actinomycetota bacterium]|nr:fumarate hydratase [Actinomycetota bacterium]